MGQFAAGLTSRQDDSPGELINYSHSVHAVDQNIHEASLINDKTKIHSANNET